MNTVFFSLASNINKTDNINEAIRRISTLPLFDLRFSPVKMYKPINFSYNSDLFANCVGKFKSSLSLERIITEMHKIESDMGRTAEYKKENPDKVILDIDIVIFNDSIIRNRDYEHEYFKDGFNYLKNNM